MMQNTSRLKYRTICRYWIVFILIITGGQNAFCQNHFGVTYNSLSTRTGSGGIWNFNTEPPKIIRKGKFENPWVKVYNENFVDGSAISDSAGEYVLTVKNYVSNIDSIFTGYLTDIVGDTVYSGVSPFCVHIHKEMRFGCTSTYPYMTYFTYENNQNGRITDVELDTIIPFTIANKQHIGKSLRKILSHPDKDTLWYIYQLKSKQDKRKKTVAKLDTIYINIQSDNGFTSYSEIIFELPEFKENVGEHTISERQIIEIGSQGKDLIYLVRFTKYSDFPLGLEWEKSYMLYIKLNLSRTQVEQVRVLDSFSYNEGIGNRINRSHCDFSPDGQSVFIGLYKNDLFWRGKQGNYHEYPYFNFYRYNVNSGKKEKVSFNNSIDTVNRLRSFNLMPNSQIYITGELDSFRRKIGDWNSVIQSHFIAKIGFPNKSVDSINFKIAEVENVQPGHFKFDYLVDLDFIYQPNNPKIDYKIISQKTCQSKGVSIKNSSSNIFTKFKWYLYNFSDSTLLDSFIGFEPNIIPMKSGNYLLLGNGTTTSGYSNWRWDYFNYSKPPEVSIDTLVTRGCQNSVVKFNGHVINDTVSNSGESWSWGFTRNDTLMLSSVNQNPEIRFNVPGIYSLQLIYKNGHCSDTVQYDSIFRVDQSPISIFTLQQEHKCSPSKVNISDSSKGNVIGWEYKLNNVVVSTKKSFQLTLDTPGNYKIKQTLFGRNGCETSDSAIFRISHGITIEGTVPLLSVNVLDSNRIAVKWKQCTICAKYLVHRHKKGGSIREIAVNDGKIDSIVDTLPFSLNLNIYQYRVQIFDSCSTAGGYSNKGTNILLSAKNVNNEYAILTWSPYSEWGNGVTEYVVESSFNKTTWLPIDAVGQLRYPDYRIPQIDNKVIYYRIRAVERGGFNSSSYSNIQKVELGSTVFLPNSFSPNDDGINDIYGGFGFGIDSFYAKIYSRWGQQLAYSSNIEVIWDGKDHLDELVPVGDYFITYFFITTDGTKVEKKGIVTVVR